MPFASKAQWRKFQAAAHAPPGKQRRIGIDRETAEKFIADSKGQSIKKLPERVKK